MPFGSRSGVMGGELCGASPPPWPSTPTSEFVFNSAESHSYTQQNLSPRIPMLCRADCWSRVLGGGFSRKNQSSILFWQMIIFLDHFSRFRSSCPPPRNCVKHAPPPPPKNWSVGGGINGQPPPEPSESPPPLVQEGPGCGPRGRRGRRWRRLGGRPRGTLGGAACRARGTPGGMSRGQAERA